MRVNATDVIDIALYVLILISWIISVVETAARLCLLSMANEFFNLATIIDYEIFVKLLTQTQRNNLFVRIVVPKFTLR